MKKTIILCIVFITIGFILGNNFFKQKSKEQEEKYYFLKEGVYTNNDIFESNIDNLKEKVMEYKNNKINVYIGITKDIEVAEKLMNIYKNENITLEEVYLKSEELKINIEQLDYLIKEATTEEEILKIEEVVLANYEEIMKNRE